MMLNTTFFAGKKFEVHGIDASAVTWRSAQEMELYDGRTTVEKVPAAPTSATTAASGDNSTVGNVSYHELSLKIGNVTLPDGPDSSSALAAIFFAYSVAFVLTVGGNLVAIVVLTRGRRCRTDVRIFLLNLAVADLIMGVVCLPASSMAATMGWLLPEFMCPLVMFLQHTSVTTSVYLNAALSVDRYLAVRFPLKRLTGSKSYIPIVILIVWLTSAAMSSVQLFVSRVAPRNESGSDKEPGDCREIWGDPAFTKYYSVIVLVSTFAVPACIFIAMYGLVCRELWLRTLPGLSDRSRETRHLKGKRKVVQMLIIMAGLFIASWLPLHLLFLLRDFYPDDLEHLKTENQIAAYYYFAHLLAISNSFQNPIIYGFLNDNFRCDLAELLLRCCPFFECFSAIKRAAASRLSSVSTYSCNGYGRPTALRLRFVNDLTTSVACKRSPERMCRRTLSDDSCYPMACSPDSEPERAMQSMATWSTSVAVTCCVNGVEVVSEPTPPVVCTDLQLALSSVAAAAIVTSCPAAESKLREVQLSSHDSDYARDLMQPDDGSEFTSIISCRQL